MKGIVLGSSQGDNRIGATIAQNETPKNGRGDRTPKWQFPHPIRDTETHPYPARARNGGDFEGPPANNGGDRTGWLGREDSNLRMAESKSPDKGSGRNVRVPARAVREVLGAGHAPKRRDWLARQRVCRVWPSMMRDHLMISCAENQQ
jgi:hypothetical protein